MKSDFLMKVYLHVPVQYTYTLLSKENLFILAQVN